jgi:hypothetical protein
MEKTDYSIEKTTVECYKIRHYRGYADITVDSLGTKGRISISSDWGNYSYFWGACGCSFKQFLININIEYVADKFGADRWFDIESTIKFYKERVKESRSDGTISKEDAKDILFEINSLKECSNRDEFMISISDCNKLMRFFDHCPEMINDISHQFKNFWKIIWPIFINQLKKEIGELKNESICSK